MKEFKGVWVSTVLNIDFPTTQNLTPAQMKAEIDSIIIHTKAVGLNAVIVQVRPTTDALYPSKIFPWSIFLTGEYGKAPGENFDPLAYWVEKAHAAGLEIHAWINPYRIAHKSQNITDLNQLSPDNPARKNPTWAVKYEGEEDGYHGAWYFDPGLPEVRQLIIDGATELVENYNIQGFHIDDYFYPARDFNDDATYAKYGSGMAKDDWRRHCVDQLIQGLHACCQKAGKRFGISPSGIWQNKSSDPRGSDTNGGEHYKNLYADTYKWIKSGWLDYIVPQIYWHIGFDIADYKVLLPWWDNVCQDTSVDLYIGMAAYRALGDRPEFIGEMPRQLTLNKQYPNVKGHVFFTYKNLLESVGQEIIDWYRQEGASV